MLDTRDARGLGRFRTSRNTRRPRFKARTDPSCQARVRRALEDLGSEVDSRTKMCLFTLILPARFESCVPLDGCLGGCYENLGYGPEVTGTERRSVDGRSTLIDRVINKSNVPGL